MNKNLKGQIAIEFLMYIGMAFFIVIAMLAVIFIVSEENTRSKNYSDIDDLGKALQQEFLLASQLENGYTRMINLPVTLNGKIYSVSIGHPASQSYYIMLEYDTIETYYIIPPVNGSIVLGDNVLRKYNGTLYLTQT